MKFKTYTSIQRPDGSVVKLIIKGYNTHKKGKKPTTIINPPPVDQKCDMCGTHVSKLKPFDGELCQAIEEYQKHLKHEYPYVSNQYITPDHKLSKTFRSFYEGYLEASWECTSCFPLSNDEAIYFYSKHTIK